MIVRILMCMSKSEKFFMAFYLHAEDDDEEEEKKNEIKMREERFLKHIYTYTRHKKLLLY